MQRRNILRNMLVVLAAVLLGIAALFVFGAFSGKAKEGELTASAANAVVSGHDQGHAAGSHSGWTNLQTAIDDADESAGSYQTPVLSEGRYYCSSGVNETSALNLEGDVTICLNGYNCTFRFLSITSGSTLTICNCSSNQATALTIGSSATNPIYGNIILNGGRLTFRSLISDPVTTGGSKSTLTINGGYVTNLNDVQSEFSSVVVKGGYFNSSGTNAGNNTVNGVKAGSGYKVVNMSNGSGYGASDWNSYKDVAQYAVMPINNGSSPSLSSKNPTYDGSAIVEGTDFGVTNPGSQTVSYSYSGASSGSGLPTNAGTYTITGTFAEKIDGANWVYYPQTKPTCSVTINRATLKASDFTYTAPTGDLTYNGAQRSASARFSVSGKTGCGTVTVRYSSSGSSYAAATPTDAGTYYVFLNVAQGSNYNAITNLNLNKSFTITQRDINSSDLAVGSDYSAVYNGQTHTITPGDIDYKDSGANDRITQDDISIGIHSNNINAGTNTASVTVNGTRNYTGSKTLKFSIAPRDINADGVSIEVAEGYIPQYDGEAQTFTVQQLTYADSGANNAITYMDAEIDAGSYSNNLDAGEGSFTVRGKGNYTGERTVTFTIKQHEVTITWQYIHNGTTYTAAAGDTVRVPYDGAEYQLSATAQGGVPNEKVEFIYRDSDGLPVSGWTDAMDGETVTATLMSVTGGKLENYTLVGSDSFTLIIEKATLKDNTQDVRATYDGQEKSVVLDIGGFVNGETLETAAGLTIEYGTSASYGYGEDLLTGVNVADSRTIYYRVTSDCYETIEGSAVLNIARATLKDNTQDVRATYDGQEKSVVLDIGGFVNGETLETAAGLTIECGTSASYGYGEDLLTGVNVADSRTIYYRITSDCYETVEGTVVLNIEKAALAPSVTIMGWTEGEAGKAPQVTGNIGGIEVSYRYTGMTVFGVRYDSVVAPTEAGAYTVTATIAAADNYAGATASKRFTIEPSDPGGSSRNLGPIIGIVIEAAALAGGVTVLTLFIVKKKKKNL